MKADRESVCVIVLCYGNRINYLQETLDSVERNDPGKILLIGNAVSKEVKGEILRRTGKSEKTYDAIFSEKNLGSAGGYAIGLKKVIETNGFEFIWLLDDDNCPAENALEVLIDFWNNNATGQNIALAAYRGSNLEPGDDLNGWVGDIPKGGSCVGFHVNNLLKPPNNKKFIRANSLPWTVYGGLFTQTSTVQLIGLPKREFFLYADDLEWTRRIIESGGRIIPCTEAELIDLCPSWNMTGGKGSNLVKRIRDIEAFRVYYEIRNRTWITRQYFPGSRVLYGFNRNLFLISAFLLSIRYRRLKRFKLIRAAIIDGEKGRLGRMPEALNES